MIKKNNEYTNKCQVMLKSSALIRFQHSTERNVRRVKYNFIDKIIFYNPLYNS